MIYEQANPTMADACSIQVEGQQFDSLKDIVDAVAESFTWSNVRIYRDKETDEVVAVVGVVMPRPGVANCWSLIARDIHDNGVVLTRRVQREISKIQKEYELRRMDMLVQCNQLTHIRWAKFLGFNQETKDEGIRNFGENGENYHLMARIW